MDYTLENPDVCKIENGQITGITNGITRLIGKLGPEKDTVIIKVQIPEKAELNMAVAPLGWSISGSSNLKNPKVAQASDGLSFCFDYSSGRSSSVKWTLKDALYGLPDSIRFVFKNGKVAFSKLVVAFKKRNSANDMIMTYEYPEIQQEYRINIPVDTFISEKEGLLPYPLSLSYMTAYLNQAQMESARNYKILMKEFSLVYKNLVVGMNSLSEINKMLIYPNPAIQQKIYIELPDDLQVTGLQASLFTLDGRLLQSSTVFRNNLLAFEYDLKGIYAGTYLLKVRTNEKSYSVKIVVR
ncbi:MAG: T9SS type A sorting domain-containing protein [Bacteroidales bacterium]